MKKAYRIKRNEEFQYVMQEGNSFANRQLVIYFVENNAQHHFRIGLSVGKKLGNAVTRNQIKRYLRQAFLELEDKIKPTVNIVIIARQPTVHMDFHQIKKSLAHLLYKTRLFND
ncbi:ribonuclease P protein component [Virgibacillus sp. W0430]|uniref:ribonuclease P protein component n=1 Tax=Virgibacillus sp. W0430 TaxID=3391580 RepID=UPI003F44FA33